MANIIKYLTIIFILIIIVSCSTLRYEDNLQEPYSQTEIEISGVGSIIITAFGIITYGVIADANNF